MLSTFFSSVDPQLMPVSSVLEKLEIVICRKKDIYVNRKIHKNKNITEELVI